MPSALRLLTVPLALAALLLAVSTTHAAAPLPDIDPLAFEEEELEYEEDEFAEEECELIEEEFEEEMLAEAICEEAEGEGSGKRAGPGAAAPEECLLRSAHASAVAPSRSGKVLKLTLGYTTYEPTGARIEVHRGSTRLGSFRRHLGRSGVLRIVESLNGKATPKRILVRIRIAGSPGYCGKYQVERVRILKRAG